MSESKNNNQWSTQNTKKTKDSATSILKTRAVWCDRMGRSCSKSSTRLVKLKDTTSSDWNEDHVWHAVYGNKYK
jgi:hypothetical protein